MNAPTVNAIQSMMLHAAEQSHACFKRKMEAEHGPMSDAAVGMLASIGIGASIKCPNGHVASPVEISMLLALGMKPDQILETMRGMKP